MMGTLNENGGAALAFIKRLEVTIVIYNDDLIVSGQNEIRSSPSLLVFHTSGRLDLNHWWSPHVIICSDVNNTVEYLTRAYFEETPINIRKDKLEWHIITLAKTDLYEGKMLRSATTWMWNEANEIDSYRMRIRKFLSIVFDKSDNAVLTLREEDWENMKYSH